MIPSSIASVKGGEASVSEISHYAAKWSFSLRRHARGGRLLCMDQPSADKHARMFEMNQKALNEARGFHDWMLQQHTDGDTIWFENVVTALLRGLVIEYEQLNTGYRESIRSMAWACRNLMEISIYTEYALRSEENAHEAN